MINPNKAQTWYVVSQYKALATIKLQINFPNNNETKKNEKYSWTDRPTERRKTTIKILITPSPNEHRYQKIEVHISYHSFEKCCKLFVWSLWRDQCNSSSAVYRARTKTFSSFSYIFFHLHSNFMKPILDLNVIKNDLLCG